MKTTASRKDATARARKILDGWLREGLSHATIAGRVGCTVRSVDNWAEGGKISNLSARSILSAESS